MRNYGQSDNIHVTKTLQKRPDKMLSNVVRRNASWMDLVAQREEDGETPTTASTKEPATAAKCKNVHNHHSNQKPKQTWQQDYHQFAICHNIKYIIKLHKFLEKAGKIRLITYTQIKRLFLKPHIL